MTYYSNGHRVEFMSSGRIAVDDRVITLGIRMTNGGHYSYAAEGVQDATATLAGRKLTGPRRPAGKYEQGLADEIVALLFA